MDRVSLLLLLLALSSAPFVSNAVRLLDLSDARRLASAPCVTPFGTLDMDACNVKPDVDVSASMTMSWKLTKPDNTSANYNLTAVLTCTPEGLDGAQAYGSCAFALGPLTAGECGMKGSSAVAVFGNPTQVAQFYLPAQGQVISGAGPSPLFSVASGSNALAQNSGNTLSAKFTLILTPAQRKAIRCGLWAAGGTPVNNVITSHAGGAHAIYDPKKLTQIFPAEAAPPAPRPRPFLCNFAFFRLFIRC